MKLFDVNILIYAHRVDQQHHASYRQRLEAALAESGLCGLISAVAGARKRTRTIARAAATRPILRQCLLRLSKSGGVVSAGRNSWSWDVLGVG